MPDIKRLGTLIDRLRKMSDEDRVPWTETSDEQAFQATFKGYAVTIAQEVEGYNYGEPSYQYAIRFYDGLGKLLDTATASDFPPGYEFEGEKKAWNALKELYDIARRKALKVDQALDDLLRSL
ncbi:MAG: hypothetical protein ABSG13_03815 [Bryobacteraceae bacterium]|jgi:hypothetical protein